MNPSAASDPAARRALLLLGGITLGTALLAVLLPRIGQAADYHDFADRRALLGLPNAGDVLSNLPFLIAALWGLRRCRSQGLAIGPIEGMLLLGLGLTAFGSSWYHLAPSNDRLVFDRIPMALAFSAVAARVVQEQLGRDLGRRLLLPLALFGILSVLYWRWSESVGRGDLRPWGAFQALPILLAIGATAVGRKRGLAQGPLIGALLAYVLAKVCEFADRPIYGFSGLLSGHTVKHLLAAAAGFGLVLWISPPSRAGAER